MKTEAINLPKHFEAADAPEARAFAEKLAEAGLAVAVLENGGTGDFVNVCLESDVARIGEDLLKAVSGCTIWRPAKA